MGSSRLRIAAVGAAALAASMLVPVGGTAVASKTQESIFQDDLALTLSGDQKRERTLDDIAFLGADIVHSVVFWGKIAPATADPHVPEGFDASDPAAYPAESWDRYDGLVRGAAARGIDLILSPSSPIPVWASACGAKSQRLTCRPRASQFRRFVTALGRRYSGEYADENQGGAVLPRVSRWSIWNEPNQGGWLTPQFVVKHRRAVPVSPVLYRQLVRAAIDGLRASGHSTDDILMGETAPIGRSSGPLSSRPMPPAPFLRGLFCIDVHGRALKGSAAKALACHNFKKLAVTGFSHHPYTRGGSQPPTAKPGPTEITISSIGRLTSILGKAASRGRIPRGLPLFYTEFGFQSDPPDKLFGVPLDKQAADLNQSDWIAFRQSRVKAVAQYEMRDEPNLASFQTGLRFLDGTPKPAFNAYRMPLWVDSAGGSLRIFGQIRPADDDAREQVDIQLAPRGTDQFTTVKTITTENRKGYLLVTVPRMSGRWRLSWTPAQGGPTVTSRIAEGPGR